MKKFSIISLIILSAVLMLFSPVNAQINPDWEKSISSGEEIYSLSLPGSDCSISLGKNGMIRIIAKDSDYYGRIISQCILLKDGSLKFEGLSIRDNENSWIFKGNGGYSVFQEKFLPYTKYLPPEVKEKFDGYFDIN